MAKYKPNYDEKTYNVNLLKYNFEMCGCSFDCDEYIKLEPSEDLKDIFKKDELLQDENYGYDNYLHVYIDEEDNNKISVTYEDLPEMPDVEIELSKEEKLYFHKILKDYINN